MASYPTAVKTFTTKSDGAGNKVFASHINDLQDEVTAIEDGILNGTAPITSSRITAASLSVSGNSTIGGNVQVVGTFTSSGAASIGGNLTARSLVIATAENSVTLSTGDNNNVSIGAIRFVYITTNSSGSTLTGMLANAAGQFVTVVNGGPAILGIKNSSGSLSSNQFNVGSDTSIAVGGGRTFYKSPFFDRWVPA